MIDNIEEINQYLMFKLAKEIFAIEILRVREVLDYTEPTRIPRSPEFLVGLINLRGNVVPVVDMRTILGMEKCDISIDSCIIIVEISLLGQTILVGTLVDSVQEVVEIGESTVEAPPTLGNKLNTEFIKSIGKRNNGFVIILNVDRVLSLEELDIVERLSTAAMPDIVMQETESHQPAGFEP